MNQNTVRAYIDFEYYPYLFIFIYSLYHKLLFVNDESEGITDRSVRVNSVKSLQITLLFFQNFHNSFIFGV